jgi:hypothetical protein
MHARLMVVLVGLGLTAFTCDPATAMASPNVAPAYSKGHGPHRPMELLQDMALQVSPALGREAAVKLLRERAGALGADAVVDVVVETVKTVVPAGQFTAVPNLVMGALMSLATWNPDALLKVTQQELSTPITRTVLVVRGVPVKFLK